MNSSVLILATDILEKIILLMLIGLSVWSVSIMIEKKRLFKKNFQNDFFSEIQKKMNQLKTREDVEAQMQEQIFLSRVLKKSLAEAQDSESFEKAVSASVKSERLVMEKGLSVLGTLGANAPFIGLFGTVLGIIRAFAYLGSQSGSSAVMSGVSQALYATAMGLLVAIPAVVANNYFANTLRVGIQQCESVRDEILSKRIFNK